MRKKIIKKIKKSTLEFIAYKGMADGQGETVKHTICKLSKTETCM